MAGPVGSRRVEVAQRRIGAWVDGFIQRHGPVTAGGAPDGSTWQLRAADGAGADLHPPAWLVPSPSRPLDPGALAALAPRYGIVLLRRAGYAVARADGQVLLARKVGSRHVHGRTAAGGWSQKRYSRRRGNQADEIAGAAAATAVRLLRDEAGDWLPAFLVTGGDRELLREALGQLPPALAQLPVAVHLGIGAPTADVLAGVPDRVLAVPVDIHEGIPVAQPQG